MKKRIAILTQNPDDGTSWYRAVIPLSELEKSHGRKSGFRFELLKREKYHWSDFAFYDAVFIHRPAGNPQLAVIEKIKELGIPIWLDYDDNLFDIPVGNPAHRFYADPSMKDSIGKILKVADVVTVTNEDLASSFRPFNPNVIVIPNAQPEFLMNAQALSKPATAAKTILWRGSQTHDEDLDAYMKPILDLAHEFRDWQWVFIGKPYFKLTKRMPKAMQIEAIPLPKYFKFLNTISAEIGVVPLEDNKFNRCKSNIAWQEFTYLGAASVVPGWPHWEVPGVITYGGEEAFYKAVRELIIDEPLRTQLKAASQEELEKNWTLRTVNLARLEIVKELVGLGE